MSDVSKATNPVQDAEAAAQADPNSRRTSGDGVHYPEVLQKLYLELANIMPPECRSAREIELKRTADTYGLALMMIAEGVEHPVRVAREALAKRPGARRGMGKLWRGQQRPTNRLRPSCDMRPSRLQRQNRSRPILCLWRHARRR